MSNEFTQVIKLPSQGLLNPEIPNGEVTQRCMMVEDQKFLSGSSHPDISQVIQRTITEPKGFNIDKLTIPDTLYLLFKLRILSYGKLYKFKARCPECGNKITVSVDLSELPVDLLDENYAAQLSVELPHKKDKVYIKFLTNEDVEEINREVKRRKRRSPEDDSEYTLRIARSIEKIELTAPDKDGKKILTTMFEIERYISALTDLDASVIINTRDSIIYGINPVFETTCPDCGEYIDMDIAFSRDFFRSSTL